MRKRVMQLTAAVLVILLLFPQAGVWAVGSPRMLRVGLAYGNGALVGANLQNNTGYGSGFRFGYYDSGLQFEELGRTSPEDTEITMVKAQNVWFYYDRSSGSYQYDTTDNGGTVIGCYHIRLPGSYSDFESARADAASHGGFVAWINGEYQVRLGAYTSKEEAQTALDGMEQGEIVGTSSYAVTVIQTGTDRILYQHDGGAEAPLGVMPDVTGAADVRTWCKGFKYHGGFQYERINGGDLTVASIVDMETYIKGVIPFEMSNNWPLEALKTQAVCARSYAWVNLSEGRHKSQHLDLCNTTCCQVYRGLGSNRSSYQATEVTDRAVEETAGICATYRGEPIPAYYSSSNGGASESIANVWGQSLSKYPYLCGVIDPYEEHCKDVNPNFSWKVEYSARELNDRLHQRGVGGGTNLDSLELVYSELGNVIRVIVHWTNGQENTFKPNGGSNSIVSMLGLKSIHFTVNGRTVGPASGGGQTGTVTVNRNDRLPDLEGCYVISAGGSINLLGEEPCAITGNGSVSKVVENSSSSGSSQGGGSVLVSGDRYVFTGGGWGHQLGMSQFGARAMADLGFGYDEIVTFYYPGVELREIY